MDNTKNADRRLEISRGIKTGKSGIDRTYEDEKTKGLIRGVAIMTKGNVKDMRGWEIDDVTLEQTAAAGNKSKLGLKSRFGHPNMSSSAMGTFLGRVRNFQIDDDVVRADLYLSKTAYETPSGDLASYVMDLAEKDPEAFGTSVVLGNYELEYRLEKNGTPKKDEQGNSLPPLLRIKTLMAADVVDDPASNEGMFGRFFNGSVELSTQATKVLDQFLNNPDALEYVIAFLERYRINRVDIDDENKPLGTATESGPAKNKEEDSMDFKDLTKDQLSKERPDLVSALQSDAVTGERSRCTSIVKAANKEFSGIGMEAIVDDALETGKTLDAALAAMRGKRLEDVKNAGNKAPGADTDDSQKTDHLARARQYKDEKKCSMTEALRATAEPRKKK